MTRSWSTTLAIITVFVASAWDSDAQAADRAAPPDRPPPAMPSAGTAPGASPRSGATGAQRGGSRTVDVHRFGDGTRLMATVRDGVIHGYSAVDRNGGPIKVTIARHGPDGIASTPGDAIEQGKMRREQAWARAGAKAGEGGAEGKWDKCWVKIANPDGSIRWWNTSCLGDKFLYE